MPNFAPDLTVLMALSKFAYGLIAYCIVHAMFTASAYIGRYTMAPNQDEVDAIVKDAASLNHESSDKTLLSARMLLAGKIHTNIMVKQVVAVTLAVVCAIGL